MIRYLGMFIPDADFAAKKTNVLVVKASTTLFYQVVYLMFVELWSLMTLFNISSIWAMSSGWFESFSSATSRILHHNVLWSVGAIRRLLQNQRYLNLHIYSWLYIWPFLQKSAYFFHVGRKLIYTAAFSFLVFPPSLCTFFGRSECMAYYAYYVHIIWWRSHNKNFVIPLWSRSYYRVHIDAIVLYNYWILKFSKYHVMISVIHFAQGIRKTSKAEFDMLPPNRQPGTQLIIFLLRFQLETILIRIVGFHRVRKEGLGFPSTWPARLQ